MPAESKAGRRRDLLAARRAVPEAVRRAEAEALCGHLAAVLGDARTVCCYVPASTEPGSAEMLDVFSRLGARALLPVVCTGSDGEHLPLRWGRYAPGTLVAGRFGLYEPAEPWLEPEAITQAQVVLVPALAVDRRGVRLGRGGGFYDRSLPLCAPGTRLVAVVRDDEVLPQLPAEPHDVPMTHALTPGRGLLRLGAAAAGECPPADGGSST